MGSTEEREKMGRDESVSWWGRGGYKTEKPNLIKVGFS
jgi:hypothetical protein